MLVLLIVAPLAVTARPPRAPGVPRGASLPNTASTVGASAPVRRDTSNLAPGGVAHSIVARAANLIVPHLG